MRKNDPYPEDLSSCVRGKEQKINTGRRELENTTHQDRSAREPQPQRQPDAHGSRGNQEL